MTAKIRSRRADARVPLPPAEWSKEWAQQLVRVLERRADLEKVPLIAGYSVTNYTETRTLDAGAASATDVANFVATIVADLIEAGFIGGP